MDGLNLWGQPELWAGGFDAIQDVTGFHGVVT